MAKKAKVFKSNAEKFNNPNKFVKKQESARAKGYDRDWDRYRFRFLHYNPNCYTCGDKARVVDHIIAHKGNQELFKMLNNHMPLCSKCHNTITGKFDRKQVQDVKGKMAHVEKMRRANNISSKIKVLPIYKK